MVRDRDGRTAEADEGPALITPDEQREAIRLLREAVDTGAMSREEFSRRLGRIHRAVTSRDLWKASGHRVGSRRRSDWREIRRAIWLQVAILVFAALAMLLVLYGSLLYYHGESAGVNAWPWNWGDH